MVVNWAAQFPPGVLGVQDVVASTIILWPSLEAEPSPSQVTQIGVEAVFSPDHLRITEFGVELAVHDPGLRVTTLAVETGILDPSLRITQFGVETAIAIEGILSPSEGEDLCGTQDDPVAFGSWLPIVSGEKIWFAEIPLDDPLSYYGGWKPDRLLQISEVRRALSATDWQNEAGTFNFELSDEDYTIRCQLGNGDSQYWYKKEVELFFVTPDARLQGAVAKKIATGFVDEDPQFDNREEGMQVQFTCRDRLSIAMGWTQQGQVQLPRRRISEYSLPNAELIVADAWSKGAQLIYGESPDLGPVASGIIAYGYVSAMPMRQNVVLPTASGVWHEFLLSGSAIKEVLAWAYILPSGTRVDGSENYAIEENQGSGTEWLVPDTPEWTAILGGTSYRDLIGGDGDARRWTLIYGQGPKANKCLNREAYIAARVRGIETVGDSSGEVLTDLHDQFRHYLENVVFVSGGGPRTTWNDQPTFGADEDTIIDYVSFEALKAQRIDQLGVPLTTFGVPGQWGELVDVPEMLVRWQANGDFRMGTNRFWQSSIHAINRFIGPEDTNPLLDTYEIHTRTFKPQPKLQELINVISYQYRKDWVIPENWVQDFNTPDPENGRSGSTTVNETSIANWGGERREGQVSFWYHYDASLMESMLEEVARRWTKVPTYVELEGSLCLMNAEFDIGSYVTLNHWRGVQGGGWIGRPMWVLSNTLMPAERRVRLELLDLKDLLEDDFSSYVDPEDGHMTGPQ